VARFVFGADAKAKALNVEDAKGQAEGAKEKQIQLVMNNWLGA